MKNILFILAMLLSVFCISTVSFADASVNAAPQSEEFIKLKEQLQQLQAQVKEHKTAADIADKALGSLSSTVSNIEGVVKQAAPQVWRIMIKQQYNKAIAGLILPFTFLFLCVLFKIIISLSWKKYTPDQIKEMIRITKTSDNHGLQIAFRTVIPLILIALSSLTFFGYTASSVQLMINPEYYAIHDTVNLVLHPDKSNE
jgi:hypothetical protein